MSTFDRDMNKSLRRLNRQEDGIREALKNCRQGQYKPEDEWGLAEVLQFVRYNTDDIVNPFDPEMLYELSHDYGISNPKEIILRWIRLSKVEKIVLDNELRIAAHHNTVQARQVMTEGYEAHLVILIYDFQPDEDPFTHVICRDEDVLKIAQLLFPEALQNPRDPGQTDYVLYLRGAGEGHRDAMLERLPNSDIWSYNDFRDDDNN